eukprot:scaffold417_cov252-Pinguiococcus_pyrenoidosus.AAC.18
MKKELRQRQGIELPDYRVGDKVRVSFLQAKSEEKPDDYVGVIIANPKKVRRSCGKLWASHLCVGPKKEDAPG